MQGDKMKSLIQAAGVKVESYWPGIFAKAIEGQDISSFFNFAGAGSSAPAEASKGPVKEEPKKQDKKEPAKKKEEPPPEEEEDAGMGGLFD